MKVLSQIALKHMKSSFVNTKNFPGYILKSNMSSSFVNLKHKSGGSLYNNYSKCFSEKSKDQSEAEEAEENNKSKRREEDEDSTLQEKYKEVKSLYHDQQAKMEALKKKFEELRSIYLSNVEETEQIKKRNDREIANTKEFAISKFAKDLLDVHDNFQRAMNSVADKDIKLLNEEEKIETYNSFLEGIELTRCGLSHVLKRHGVNEYSPLKEKFDPNKHEAVFDYEDDELNPGVVGQVLQSGFKIGDRVLRPAKVGVVKRHNK